MRKRPDSGGSARPWRKRSLGPRANQWNGGHSAAKGSRAAWPFGKARRQLFWRCLRPLVLLGAAGAGLWSAALLSEDAGLLLHRWFVIRTVTVEGIQHLTRNDVIDRLGLNPNATLWSIYTPQLVHRLAADPWVKEVGITRAPFHEIRVTIAERQPAAVVRTSGESLLADGEGHVLTGLDVADHVALPLLKGVDTKGLLRGDTQPRQTVKAGVQLARLVGQTLDGRPEVDVGESTHLAVTMKGLRFQFGPSSFEEQWERFRKIRSNVRVAVFEGSERGAREIDLRYSGRVIVRERG